MLVLTSKHRTAQLVFSADPQVVFAEGKRPDKPAWVPVGEAVAVEGCHVADVRALSWLEWTEAEALKLPGENMLAVVRAGLVGFGDAENKVRAAFLADPNPALVTPLYHAIAGLTWGN